jgi:putative FmdB family regulatory protein
VTFTTMTVLTGSQQVLHGWPRRRPCYHRDWHSRAQSANTWRRDVPTYSYACTACEHHFDTVQKFTDSSLTDCPECSGPLRKLFSSVGIVFKGSGFYRTDSRASSPGEPSSNGKSESGSNGKSELKPAKSGSTSDSKSSPDSKPGSGSASSSSASSSATSTAS